MTGTVSVLASLLAECDGHGIRLALAGDGGLTIDAPQDALTLDLLDRLKTHKAGLLAMLGAKHGPVQSNEIERHKKTDGIPKPVCRCGSTTWQDVPIHGGQSVRRDCGRCRRFIEFPVWHGKNAGRNGQ